MAKKNTHVVVRGFAFEEAAKEGEDAVNVQYKKGLEVTLKGGALEFAMANGCAKKLEAKK